MLFVSFLFLAHPLRAQTDKSKVPAPPRKEMSAKEIANSVLPAVALLVCSDGNDVVQGSGFFVFPGILVTNYHVIEKMRRGVVTVTKTGESQKSSFRVSRIVAFDREADLALLAVPGARRAGVPTLKLIDKSVSVAIGEDVFALGNPEGLTGTISPGIVSANLRYSDKKARLQITAPISHGSSGGPVVDKNGGVVGVAVSSLSEGQNLNFAVPAILVHSLLEGTSLPTESEFVSDLASEVSRPNEQDWRWSENGVVSPVKARVPSVIGPLRAGEDKRDASLRGLQGIEIVVEDLSDVGQRLLNQGDIATQIERELRRNGIKVVKSSNSLPGMPYLYINIGVVRSVVGSRLVGYAYSISIELNQAVLLERDSNFSMFATTWDSGVTGIVSDDEAEEVIMDGVLRKINQFSGAFLKANNH